MEMKYRTPLLLIPIFSCLLFWVPNSVAQNYSLVVGVDGLGTYGLSAGATPNIRSLIDGTWAGVGTNYRTSSTFGAYAGGVLGTSTQQGTISGPGWSSILTGVWVDKHGVTNNTFSGSQYATWPAYLKTLESQVANIRTAGVVTWSPINTFTFAPDGVNPNIDFTQGTNSDAVTATTAVAQIGNLPTTGPGAVFIHLDDCDIAGHNSGAYSANYLGQVADVDTQIGSMLTAVRNRANFSTENWQVIVISDHGHVGTGGHGGQTMMERSIPIMVSSKTAVQGLMPTDARQPSQVDLSATVLNHFGVATPSGQAGIPIGNAALNLSSRSSLLSGLMTHLNFEGNTNGSNGAPGGTAFGNVQYSTGRFGQAGLVATYGTGYVVLNSDLGAQFGNNTDFAMSLWVKYSSFTGDPAFLSNKDWDSGANTGINFALQTVGGGSLDLNTKAVGGVRRDIEPFGGVGPSVWHHMLVNVDRDGRTLLYINGALYGEVTQSSVGSFDGISNWTFFNDGTGDYQQGNATNLMLDEFGAWSRLLTLDEIAYLSKSPIVAPAQVIRGFANHLGYSGTGSSIDSGKSLAEEGTGPTLLSFNNLINTSRGINGIALAIQGLGNPSGLSAADFVFQVSPQGAFNEGSNPPSGWSSAPAPVTVAVTPGTVDLVHINWADNVIENRWLRITIAANANTGLLAPKTYYLGHLRGETDAAGAPFTVAFADISPIRSAVGGSVDSSSIFDIDKSGTVSFADISAMRNNVGAQLTIITIQ